MPETYLIVAASTPVADVQQLITEQASTQVAVWEVEAGEVRYWLVRGTAIGNLSSSTAPLGEVLHLAEVAPDDQIQAGEGAGQRTPDQIAAVVREALRARWTEAPLGLFGVAEVPPEGGATDDGGLSAYAVRVDYPRSVTIGDPMSVLVSITAAVTASSTIPFAGVRGEAIDVVVSPKRGFVIDGSTEARLTVGAEPEATARVRLKAVTEGPGEIVCYAFRGGSVLGSLTIRPEVIAAGSPTGGRDVAEVRAEAASNVARADLELIVLAERNDEDQPVLRYLLDATDPELGLNLKEFGPVPVTGGPAAYFFSLFADISAIPVETANLRRLAAERLAAIGSTLFTQLFPSDLQVLLWGLRDRIHSVLIQSEEPWVPWELCRLQGRVEGRIVEGPFLCEAFEVARWMPGTPRSQKLTASSIGVVQPPAADLPSAAQEAAMLQGLATAGPPPRTVAAIPPNYTAVRAALGAATHDVVHFVGHGRFPDADQPQRAELVLTGTQVLRPDDLSGATANLGLSKPIVFLNACQSGVKSVGLTGNGGWVNALLTAGAGAFVGSHWDVTDSLALAFATEFYRRLLTGDTVPAAVHAARLSIRDDGDPTWLAYAVYADPRARVG